MNNITFYPAPEVDESLIKYAVIVAKFHDQWIFCRHKDRDTWEIPGGHREFGETPLEAARRELWEETGAVDADLKVVGAYKLNDYGLLCFADVKKMEAIPCGSEIKEISFVNVIPQKLTYGAAHEQLFKWVQGWLNMQSGSEELWDVYDEKRKLTGRLHRRGDFLPCGDYHLVVHVWIVSSNGEILLTKRSPNKGFPNMWEGPGGSASAGDDSLTAAIREVYEETGLKLHPENGKCVITYTRRDTFTDVWLFRQDVDVSEVVLLEGETCDKMLVSPDQLLQMHKEGILVPFCYLDDLVEMIKAEI